MLTQQSISAAWYQGRWWWYLLFPLTMPLSWLFVLVAKRRRYSHQSNTEDLPVPVLVVGNIAVGGTGKTPVIIGLANYLRDKNLRPGIISRGYGAKAPYYPFPVDAASSPEQVGDEPLLITNATGCPVVVGPDRYAAAQYLLANNNCDIILSDDGMQHYALPRQFELCVMDAQRGLGNGYCLPAGPLREPPERLQEVDLILANGNLTEAAQSQLNRYTEGATEVAAMRLKPTRWINIKTGDEFEVTQTQGQNDEQKNLSLPWGDEAVFAVSGIGNPQRFFDSLVELGVDAQTKPFDDHHKFVEEDFFEASNKPVVMTSKDAVKCQNFAQNNWWSLAIEAEFDHTFYESIDQFIAPLIKK